jgi:flagellar assembly protein FliH
MVNAFERYEYKELESSNSDREFVGDKKAKKSDFEINKLSVNESGLLKYSRDQIQKRLEDEVEERIKIVEQKAYKEAFELGLIEGSNQAYNDLKKEIRSKIEDLSQLCDTLKFQRTLLGKQYEKDIIMLIVEICRTVIAKEIESDKKIITNIVLQLLKDIDNDKKVSLFFSRNDYSTITAQDMNINELFKHNVDLYEDEKLSAGDCIIKTEEGVIDATIQVKIEELWNHFEKLLPET